MGLVADDEIEIPEPLALGIGDDLDTLVGGEDDRAAVILHRLRGDCQLVRVRGRGIGQIVGA